MRIIGIIAEYNPFHHGHRYQIETLRRQFPDTEGIVAAMSGSFTQRGAPAVLDKWTRAQHAVMGGIDLVLELPFVFSCRSAQDFARGGVSLLSRLGIVDALAFGTEAEDIAPLRALANETDTAHIQQMLRKNMSEGCSYAAALTRALAPLLAGAEDLLRQPNNILAIEYLRALRPLPGITPIAVPRRAAQHSDTELHTGITSAGSIRRALHCDEPPWALLGSSVSSAVLAQLKEERACKALPSNDILLTLLRYALLRATTPQIQDIYGVSEGIENRILRSLRDAHDYDAFLAAASAKRYPQTRIARLALHILLQLKKIQASTFDACGAAYIRPLAFNVRGRMLLRRIKKESSLPIITRTAEFLRTAERSRPVEEQSILPQMLAFDTRATELRLLTIKTQNQQHPRTDFITAPQFYDDRKG